MEFWNVKYYTQRPFTDTVMVMAKNQEHAQKKCMEITNKERKDICLTEICKGWKDENN
jgi:hypothetical protein